MDPTRKILNLRDQPIKESITGEELTVGRIMAELLITTKPERPYEALRFMELAKILDKTTSKIGLEEEDFLLVKKVCDKNSKGYNAMYMAPVYKVIEDSRTDEKK